MYMLMIVQREAKKKTSTYSQTSTILNCNQNLNSYTDAKEKNKQIIYTQDKTTINYFATSIHTHKQTKTTIILKLTNLNM